MDIKEALAKLEPSNDGHWTSLGTPKIESVSALLGRGVTRKEITDASPQFTRDNPVVELPAPASTEEPEVSVKPSEDGQEPLPDAQEDSPQARAQAALPEAQERLEAARKALTDAKDAFLAAQATVDRLLVMTEQEKGHREQQIEMQRFLQSQHEQRVKRAIAAGVMTGAKSALDQSLNARKRQVAQR